MKQGQLLVALVLASFVKGCVYPGWPAVAELIVVSALVGYVVWLNPSRPVEIKAAEFEALKQSHEELRETLKGLQMKIGFIRPTSNMRG